MMKKHNAFRYLLLSFVMAGCLILLSACASLTYTGDDYKAENTLLVQTDELFNFVTYKKTSAADKIDMRIGISASPLSDALVAYVNIKNNSADEYPFYLKDIAFSHNGEKIDIIAPSSYIEAYQSFETGNYAGLSNIAPTLGAIANIQNSYQQTTNASQVARQQSTSQAASSQIGRIVNGITSHTITNSAVIEPYSSQFFYIFIKNPENYPIDVTYKDLNYKFGTSKAQSTAQ